MIFALLAYQILLIPLIIADTDTTTKVIFGVIMFFCALIAQARWSAVWVELNSLKKREEKRENRFQPVRNLSLGRPRTVDKDSTSTDCL